MQPVAPRAAGPAATPKPPVLLVRAAPASLGLGPGDVLRAQVTAVLGDGRVRLSAGSAELEARTALALRAGDVLDLRVRRATARTLHLERLPPPPAPRGRAPTPAAALLREALPRQIPLGRALRSMAALAPGAAPPAGGGPPTPLLAALAELLRAAPSRAETAEPARLRAAIEDAGPFLEAKLARGRTDRVGRDLKAALLRLVEAASRPGAGQADSDRTPAPPRDAAPGPARVPAGGGAPAAGPRVGDLADLADLADRALQRIRVAQAGALERDASGAASLRLEVPVRSENGYEALELTVHRRPRRRRAGAAWSVELDLEPPGLGRVHARVSLLDGAVSALLEVEDEGARARLREARPELCSALERSGLRIGTVECRGPRPDGATGPPSGAPDGERGRVVRERA